MSTTDAVVTPAPGRCPVCGSPDIEGEPVEIDGTHAYQRCRCDECGAGWTDAYDVAGYVRDDDAARIRPYGTRVPDDDGRRG